VTECPSRSNVTAPQYQLSPLVLKMGVLVGQVVWIAGLLLMLLSEAAKHTNSRFTRYSSVFAVLVLS
jgi:hypothetical protein